MENTSGSGQYTPKVVAPPRKYVECPKCKNPVEYKYTREKCPYCDHEFDVLE
jgi:Zn finger protein HypA/HybF involved in hydrogenase expression